MDRKRGTRAKTQPEAASAVSGALTQKCFSGMLSTWSSESLVQAQENDQLSRRRFNPSLSPLRIPLQRKLKVHLGSPHKKGRKWGREREREEGRN